MTGPPPLKALLEAADLLAFELPLTCDLRLRHAGDIEYVDEDDLTGIGMSRPEQKRLRKEYARMFPRTGIVGKLKKAFSKDANDFKRINGGDKSAEAAQQHVIPIENITLAKQLGTGEFGTVHQAYWRTGEKSDTMQVAVKCVSSEKLLSNPSSFLSEAAIMCRMHHDDVVKLYGVVLDTKNIMIVSELASCGSLQACLLNPTLRDSFPVQQLCSFTVQIARGMSYLESQRLIHRDLAARNVLVFSANKVKISDFGLSRSLGVGEDYYRSEFSPTLRLPIAWCAPECINFLKFTHASDVWAFGVTLWEMFSYGRPPWEGKSGADILDTVDKQRRHLPRPVLCPDDMYAVMVECWAHDAMKRPSFAALLAALPDKMPVCVRTITTLPHAPTAEHVTYAKDDVIYVIDKCPSSSPDGSYWLGSLCNGRTGLFDPKDTVAHLGAEPPASNRADLALEGKRAEKEGEKKSKKKEKESKESERERRKALISEPTTVRHVGHLGIDGTNFGLLQMDKKDMSNGGGASGSASASSRSCAGELSPSSVHSAHSQRSSNTTSSSGTAASCSSINKPSPTPLSPPTLRAPTVTFAPPSSAEITISPPPPVLHPRANRSITTGGATSMPQWNVATTTSLARKREPSAPPLIDDQWDSGWSEGATTVDTTTTSIDTLSSLERRGRPIAAVYARGRADGMGLEDTTTSSEDALLLSTLEKHQRDLTDFSLYSMASSTAEDTRPLIVRNGHRSPPQAMSWSCDSSAALRLMSTGERERLEEWERKENKKAGRALAASKQSSRSSTPVGLETTGTAGGGDSSHVERKRCAAGISTTTNDNNWTPEAQEAYRLIVECGTFLRDSVSPTPSPSASSSSAATTVTQISVPEATVASGRCVSSSPTRPASQASSIQLSTATSTLQRHSASPSPFPKDCDSAAPTLPPRNPYESAPVPQRPPKPVKIDASNPGVMNYDNLNGYGAGAGYGRGEGEEGEEEERRSGGGCTERAPSPSSKRPGPPVPPKPRVRIVAPSNTVTVSNDLSMPTRTSVTVTLDRLSNGATVVKAATSPNGGLKGALPFPTNCSGSGGNKRSPEKYRTDFASAVQHSSLLNGKKMQEEILHF